MPRTEVYQLRLTSEEKGRLAHLAQEKDLSIAGMIREDYGLDLGREPEPVKERPAKASVEDARPVGSTPTPSADKRFKQLVAQLQSRMPLKDAEETARKRLGME